MLTVYRQRADIPAGVVVIEDAQRAFSNMKIDLTDALVRKALLEIDGAVVNSDGSLTSKFGNRIFLYNVSMGCQCAIVALYSDYIVNTAEAGDNAFNFILQNKSRGGLYQPYPRYTVVVDVQEPIMYGGTLCTTSNSLYEEARR